MSETLARRVGRLVSGGFHAILDAAENLAPEAVMNENIREIERAIDEVRSELGKVLVQKHLATKKMADESNRHETLQADIQEALKANRDDLAEIGIAEQMDIEARLPVLENTVADCAARRRVFRFAKRGGALLRAAPAVCRATALPPAPAGRGV